MFDDDLLFFDEDYLLNEADDDGADELAQAVSDVEDQTGSNGNNTDNNAEDNTDDQNQNNDDNQDDQNADDTGADDGTDDNTDGTTDDGTADDDQETTDDGTDQTADGTDQTEEQPNAVSPFILISYIDRLNEINDALSLLSDSLYEINTDDNAQLVYFLKDEVSTTQNQIKILVQGQIKNLDIEKITELYASLNEKVAFIQKLYEKILKPESNDKEEK